MTKMRKPELCSDFTLKGSAVNPIDLGSDLPQVKELKLSCYRLALFYMYY